MREAVIARPSALKSRIKPTNVCSNSFSAVRDLQTIRFGACEVYAGDFSLGRLEGATLTSAHAECASGGSPQPLSATTSPVGSETGCLHNYLG